MIQLTRRTLFFWIVTSTGTPTSSSQTTGSDMARASVSGSVLPTILVLRATTGRTTLVIFLTFAALGLEARFFLRLVFFALRLAAMSPPYSVCSAEALVSESSGGSS